MSRYPPPQAHPHPPCAPSLSLPPWSVALGSLASFVGCLFGYYSYKADWLNCKVSTPIFKALDNVLEEDLCFIAPHVPRRPNRSLDCTELNRRRTQSVMRLYWTEQTTYPIGHETVPNWTDDVPNRLWDCTELNRRRTQPVMRLYWTEQTTYPIGHETELNWTDDVPSVFKRSFIRLPFRSCACFQAVIICF